jgi:hypothetical protein
MKKFYQGLKNVLSNKVANKVTCNYSDNYYGDQVCVCS